MGSKASLSITVWDSGKVTVSMETGEYHKVGYRSANLNLVPCGTLDGRETYVPEWSGEGAELGRILAALDGGKRTNPGKLLSDIFQALHGAAGKMRPSAYDIEREERWKKEAAEAEERDRAPATEVAPDGPDNT